MKTRINPMRMMDRAAIRSPMILILRDIIEAETPVKKRMGTVPSPNRNMVKKPIAGFPVVAALRTIAQESAQGRKPVRMPSAIFEIKC